MVPASKLTQRDPVRRVLVIDDDLDTRASLGRLLDWAGYDCAELTNPGDLEELIGQHQPHLILADLPIPDGTGVGILERISRCDEAIPVIVVATHGCIEHAVAAMKHGAVDYLTKPVAMDALFRAIQAALNPRDVALGSPAETVAGDEEDPQWRAGIIGVSPAIRRAIELVQKAAKTNVNAVIIGESGTGKELLARAIHQAGARHGEVFIPVDCTGLSENLLESELYGYCRGAFTGANTGKPGLFEFAHRGTLFLDDIGEMTTALQAKLLRVLRERRFRRIGGNSEIQVDIRVVAATNRNLEQALQDRAFRADLYYRLNVVTLYLAPLRERREDIPLLASHFLRSLTRDSDPRMERFSSEALSSLKAYEWPGNVRELRNVIAHAITLATGSLIEVGDLPKELQRYGRILAHARDSSGNEGNQSTLGLFAMKDQLVRSFERESLLSLLSKHLFNVSRAANAAGCQRRTLYRLIHRHNLDLCSLRRCARETGVDEEGQSGR